MTSSIQRRYTVDDRTVLYSTSATYDALEGSGRSQVIAVEFSSDKEGPAAFFLDLARRIYGRVDLADFDEGPCLNVDEVHDCYIRGWYEPCGAGPRFWELETRVAPFVKEVMTRVVL